MVRKRPGKGQPASKASILRERRRNNARRERSVVREAIRMRTFSPSQRIQIMIELSNLCVKLGRGRKNV
jgi:hypothetical protein